MVRFESTDPEQESGEPGESPAAVLYHARAMSPAPRFPVSDAPPDELASILKERFGHDAFQPRQLDAVRAVLAGRDVLVTMPTGAGKSLVYQFPAVVLEGLTLVISPLIALMKDQVDGLRARGLDASYIN